MGRCRRGCRRGQGRLFLDEDDIVCMQCQGGPCAVVPESMVPAILQFAHGSHLTGHYGMSRTCERIRRSYWWSGWRRDVRTKLDACVPCASAKARRPARNARMHVYHPKRRFAQKAVDVQTITPRTTAGNVKVLVVVENFTRFAKSQSQTSGRRR